MTKVKRKTNLKAVALLLFVGVLALAGIVPAFADSLPAGVDISTDTTTVYKMELPVNNIECYLNAPAYNDPSWPTMGSYYDLIDGNYKTPRTGTVIVTFNNVQYETMPVMITGLCQIKYPPLTTTDKTIRFHSDITVNIRESYYRYFTEKAEPDDWSNVSFMFVLGNSGYSGGRMDSIYNTRFDVSGVRLYTEEVPGDPNDPDDPNFDIGDNGGQNANPEPEQPSGALERFYDFLTSIFHWKLSYTGFLWIFWSIVGILGLALIMPLLRRIFGW